MLKNEVFGQSEGEAKNGCGCYTYRNKSNTQWQDSGTAYNQNTVSLFFYYCILRKENIAGTQKAGYTCV